MINNPGIQIQKRNGDNVAFDKSKIASAIEKAFNACNQYADYEALTDAVTTVLLDDIHSNIIAIEVVQDAVVNILDLQGYSDVAKSYNDYRVSHVKSRVNYQFSDALDLINAYSNGLDIDNDRLLVRFEANKIGNSVTQALVMSCRELIETNPDYSYLAARMVIHDIHEDTKSLGFHGFIAKGVDHGRLAPKLLSFDLDRLADEIDDTRNDMFTYIAIDTLSSRYLIHENGVIYERPQWMFMRVAMGLADTTEQCLAYYNILSSFRFMSSTPTLFNSGTLHPQLSSCFLTTVPDDLNGIFGAIQDNAMLQKWAGGLGNDWTPVRGMGARIKGTNGLSQGVVPFMKVANDTLVAVNQGGKRKGSGCAYLETWHIDIEEFLELRKNTGDERRRTHDMNTANWIPDLFMERVTQQQDWTLFSPDETPDLHDLFGEAFAARYIQYELDADCGKINLFKRVKAVDLWRKMLTMLFETGHPWITFKDACNIRNPQQHVGVVHSSNLCTEITLNTIANEEIAVCNLGSVNLVNHVDDYGVIDHDKLRHTVFVAIEMLNQVIDENYFPVEAARNATVKHRPIGLGIMGFQDVLYKLGVSYESDEALKFADESMEAISYYAINTSCALAFKDGAYSSFEGSLWSKGKLPIDTVRGDIDSSSRFDWDTLRERVREFGMRNSNVLAIAPTATISNICGVSQSIEPTFQNLYVKSNLNGEFTVINQYLVAALKKLGLWNAEMLRKLKESDGSVQGIDEIPDAIKAVYKTAFEIDPTALVECGAKRQKWIDQAQSLNLYMAEPSGRKLDHLYKLAWSRGLKTTYYLRTMGATHVEKTTDIPEAKACSIDDPDCEACQ